MHVTLYVVTAWSVIAVYLGLASYVITHSPRRTISWVFGAFCFLLSAYYGTSLLLFPVSREVVVTSSVPLRIKWVLLSFTPTVYLHLASFFFPSSWRRRREIFLLPAYFLSLFFALLAGFTSLLIAGPLDRGPNLIIGATPGPLMVSFAAFFLGVCILAVFGLAISYRSAYSPGFRKRIRFLSIPTVILLLNAAGNWAIVLSEEAVFIPFEIGNAITVLAGMFFTRAILGYGSLIGQPLAYRELLYSTVLMALVLVTIYVAWQIDRYLIHFEGIPFPLVIGWVIVFWGAVFSLAWNTIEHWGDKLFFRSLRVDIKETESLVNFAGDHAPAALQAELLGTLCSALAVRGGFIALAHPIQIREEEQAVSKPSGSPTLPLDLKIQLVVGQMDVKPGGCVRRPPRVKPEPVLIGADFLPLTEMEGWKQVSLFCRLVPRSGVEALVALGEKKDGSSFNATEIALCKALVRQIEAALKMQILGQQRDLHLRRAENQVSAIRSLEKQVIAATHKTLEDLAVGAEALQIGVLGPLQVRVCGRPIPEAAWQSERAKALLVFLLWKGPDGATRDEIAELLWPDAAIDRQANVFHVTMNRLRSTLEPELNRVRDSHYILHEGGKYYFNFNAPQWLDLSEFEALAGDPEDVDGLRRAAALYRGSYMEDMIYVLPAEVEVRRRSLEKLYESVLRALIQKVDLHEAEIYLTRLLAIDPTDEQAQQQLKALYRARGRTDLEQELETRWLHAMENLGLEARLPEDKVTEN